MTGRLLLLVLAFLLFLGGCGHEPKVIKTCRIIAVAGESVLAQTRAHYQIEYDSSGVGVFVKAVDGVPQTKSAYWLYFINGKGGQVSCEECMPNEGDTVEWRLTSSF
ncbi:MAG: DUF4430 domain-containing protein [Candidatus Zixiibacteriota bacterium]|nr:MAG: DUF4430 domain-containing protein [candidate division Zixibacteria bacterium]